MDLCASCCFWQYCLSVASFNIAKVIVVGDVAVGKTCLISRWEVVMNNLTWWRPELRLRCLLRSFVCTVRSCGSLKLCSTKTWLNLIVMVQTSFQERLCSYVCRLKTLQAFYLRFTFSLMLLIAGKLTARTTCEYQSKEFRDTKQRTVSVFSNLMKDSQFLYLHSVSWHDYIFFIFFPIIFVRVFCFSQNYFSGIL